MVALFAMVSTVVHDAQVATVAPRSSTAGTLLLFNNSVRTAKKTHVTTMKTSLFMLFEEIIAVYTENRTKHKKVPACRLSSRWDGYLPLGFKWLMFYFTVTCMELQTSTC
jgi:hypothetical protein